MPTALQNPDTRIKPFEVLNVVDYGDAAVDPFSIESSMGPIRELVREVAETGALPFVLGGDHSILAQRCRNRRRLRRRQCRRHPPRHTRRLQQQDLRAPGHHGTPIRRLIEDEHIPARNFVQIGLHSFVVPDDELLAWMRKKGMRSHHMAEINRFGFEAVLEKAIAEALTGRSTLHLPRHRRLDRRSLPGPAHRTGGLTPRELLPAIRRLCHETPVVGFEMVEVAPHLDPGYTTALYARRAILKALTGIAQRKLGIKEKNYLDPVVCGTVPFPEPGA